MHLACPTCWRSQAFFQYAAEASAPKIFLNPHLALSAKASRKNYLTEPGTSAPQALATRAKSPTKPAAYHPRTSSRRLKRGNKPDSHLTNAHKPHTQKDPADNPSAGSSKVQNT